MADRISRFVGDQPRSRNLGDGNNQIRPLARLFRGMADLIDQDHTSQTGCEAIAKAAVVAARATAEELVAGRLWQVDGADLLASA